MKIFKNDLSIEELEIAESLLFNGNGHIGVRNVLEECDYSHFETNRHTYINGFYDTYIIKYPEQYYGATTKGEQMLPTIDGTLSEIRIGDIKVDMRHGEIGEHARYLDLTKGIAVRSYIFTDKQGHQTSIRSERITSFVEKEQLSTRYTFEKINHDLPIEIRTHIKFTVDQNIDPHDPRVAHNKFKIDIVSNNIENKLVEFSAPNSGCKGYFAWDISDVKGITSTDNGIVVTSKVDDRFLKAYTYSLEKFIVPNTKFDMLLIAQKLYLDEFWKVSKVNVKAKTDIESSINYGTYALLQSVSEKSIAAKGLSGNGYEGHVFWDAEMYVFPVFNKTNPVIARSMLMYRIKMLEKAIDNRKLVGYPDGALYPWRTITGLESSAFFEAGMAQHHINVDITYALYKYIEQSGDYTILTDGGYEMMSEIGKMFASIMSKDDNGYHLDLVTGPDEYSALVSDNFYTNSLVKLHFENLIKYTSFMPDNLKISNELIDLYKKIATNIVLPFDEKLQIASQDRDFLNKAKWPYEIVGDKPLLLKYHPLEIYRHQVSKQADVVLAMQLVGQSLFSNDIIENTINYYEKVTTHDSSLSFSSFATVYARLGHDLAYKYFLKNARLDLDNLHHNTKDGIHTASMGGTYQTLVDGFTNYQIKDGKIYVENNLPYEIKYLEYKVEFQKTIYSIEVKQGEEPKITKVERNEI